MKIARFFSIILSVMLLIGLSSCSSEKIPEFQTMDEPADFNLFNIFKDYPSIKEGWDKVQPYVFNQGLAALIGDTPTDRLKDVLNLLDDLVEKEPNYPLFATFDILGRLIDTIQDQDTKDEENEGGTETSTYYADTLTLLDKLSDSNAQFSRNLMPVIARL
ncbi:MAG: hypothetical protein JXA07_12360, partial [Spirochaetes bacterium]|nr:hypothetical protein [Spirochaetota bacterium]